MEIDPAGGAVCWNVEDFPVDCAAWGDPGGAALGRNYEQHRAFATRSLVCTRCQGSARSIGRPVEPGRLIGSADHTRFSFYNAFLPMNIERYYDFWNRGT